MADTDKPKLKCPHCGSTDYQLLRTEFENRPRTQIGTSEVEIDTTAKIHTRRCSQCGKEWKERIPVKG
jgi:DNA-directed RNA polymerase subunit RPC12/RpoP